MPSAADIPAIGLGLLGLVLLTALGSGISRWRAPAEAREAAPEPAWMRAARVALITALVLGLRVVLGAPTPIHDDALRDLGSAMTCGLEGCAYVATASFGGFEHGTSLTRFLGLFVRLGLGVRGAQLGVMLAFAVAVAVNFEVGLGLDVRRPWREATGATSPDGARGEQGRGPRWCVGALAAAGSLALLAWELGDTGEILWNPSLMALPAALTQAFLVRGAVTGRAAPLLLAGVFAGLAFDVHVAGLALWPAVVIVAVATARAPGSIARSAALASWLWLPVIAAALFVPMLLSPHSAAADAVALSNILGWAGCLGAALSTLVVGVALRRWLARAPRAGSSTLRRPVVVALLVPILVLGGALLASAGFVEYRPVRYFAPVFPAVALTAAWLGGLSLAQLPAGRTRAGACALAAGLALALASPAYVQRVALDRDRWSYADVDALAAFLRERGVSHDELHHVVRGGLCDRRGFGDRGQRLDELLLAGLRGLGGLGEGVVGDEAARGRGEPSAWLVTKLRGALPPLPEGAEILASGAGRSIVLVPLEPVVDLAAARQCAELDGERRCVDATPRPVQLELRQVLPRHASVAAPEQGQVSAVDYELPLRWSADRASSRRVSLRIVANEGVSPWRFVELRGALAVEDAALPAMTLDLTLEPGTEATVVLRTSAVDEVLWSPWWPPVLELPDDPRTRALFVDEPGE